MSNARPFDLLAFDLDGTTIPHAEKFMPEPVKRALTHAHEAGIKVAAVTGRPVDMLSFIYDEPWMDYLITLNGGLVRRASNREELFGAPLAPAQAEAIFCALAEFGCGWFAFTRDASYMERGIFSYMVKSSAGLSPEELKTHFPGSVFVDSVPQLVAGRDFAGIYKLQVSFSSPAARDAGAERLESLGGLELARMGALEVEVTTAGADKGTALVRLARELGIDPARCVAFGDDGNDLAMAGRVGTFVAVANASEKILAAADEVCPSVDECGVATWVEALLR